MTGIHFEVDADDVDRAKGFYENVFGWTIRPWGPPNYYLIDTGVAMISGDIRERDPASVARGRRGFVCTIGVDNLKATEAAVLANGGNIETREIRIEGCRFATARHGGGPDGRSARSRGT